MLDRIFIDTVEFQPPTFNEVNGAQNYIDFSIGVV